MKCFEIIHLVFLIAHLKLLTVNMKCFEISAGTCTVQPLAINRKHEMFWNSYRKGYWCKW